MSFAVYIGLLLGLLVLGLPVAFSLDLVGMIGFGSLLGEPGLRLVPKIMYDSMQHFILTAVPLFMVMGKFLADGGIGRRLYEFAQVWLRHLPGGIAVATVASCGIMAAVAGSSTAIVAAVGIIAIPELLKRGYSLRDSTGVVAAGSTLGILIPPSIPLLIYSAVTDESAGKLFLAGVFPGILLTVLMGIIVSFRAWRRGLPTTPRASWKERMEATREASWALALPIIVLGTIYSGIATPTESAAIGAVFAAFVAIFVYRTVNLRDCIKIMKSAAATSIMILFIVQGALVFGKYATMIRAPHEIVAWATSFNLSATEFVIGANLLFLVLGHFLEVISILLISLPVMLETMKALGVDLTWFAIVMVINMEMALISPPVGINLYVTAGVAASVGVKVSQWDIIVGTIPYFLLMLAFMVLLIVAPQIVTFIPSLLYN